MQSRRGAWRARARAAPPGPFWRNFLRTEREKEREKTHSPGVELVDDALEADDSEESGAEAG